MALDLLTLPIHRRRGEKQPGLPGFRLASPPRRAARQRRNEQLLIFLSFTGTATFPADGLEKLLQRVSETYYHTPGAVTSALRAAVDSLNLFLLDRNRKGAQKGLQATGLLVMAVYRHGRLYLARCGPTHVFVVQQERSEHLHQSPSAGHGLGLGRSAAMQVTPLNPEQGDLIVITPSPPPSWTPEALQKAHARNLTGIYHGLLGAAGEDVQALLIQAQPGKGEFRLIKPGRRQQSTVTPRVATEIQERRPQIKSLVTEADAPPGESQAAVVTEPQPPAPIQPASPPDEPPPESPPVDPSPPEAAAASRRKPVLGPALLAVGRAFQNALRALWYTTRSTLTRLLPGTELFTIPSNVMAFIAVAVPLILVTIASLVYLRRGRLGQYYQYVQLAEAAQTNAEGKTDPQEVRTAWEAVLFYVDQAEAYQTTEETQALRVRAQTRLDQLDGVERLTFQPALQGNLADTFVIKRMAATDDEIYLLNANGGNIVRGWLSGRGYELDPDFLCTPGSYGAYIVGAMIDLAPLPKNNDLDAAVIAMDSNGILVYCRVDKPVLTQPLVPPDSNWGDPIAFALDSGNLYVLDPTTNAVWMYTGEDYTFVDRPRLFFDEEVPSMQDVIDLAVDNGELFLLHEDGRITICNFGFGDLRTQCTDPAIFTDTRVGRQNAPVFADTQFTQIAFTPPPDPSIYLFEPFQQAIYHFSLRLTFQRQYRPQVLSGPPASLPATAFAFTPNRTVLLAVGDQVYVAPLP